MGISRFLPISAWLHWLQVLSLGDTHEARDHLAAEAFVKNFLSSLATVLLASSSDVLFFDVELLSNCARPDHEVGRPIGKLQCQDSISHCPHELPCPSALFHTVALMAGGGPEKVGDRGVPPETTIAEPTPPEGLK